MVGAEDVTLSTEPEFTTSALCVGTHLISFKVQDDDENWSPPDTAEVTIRSSGGPTCDINGDGIEDTLNDVGSYINGLKDIDKTLRRTLVGLLRTAQRYFDQGKTDDGCQELGTFVSTFDENAGSFSQTEASRIRAGVCCIHDREADWDCGFCPWE